MNGDVWAVAFLAGLFFLGIWIYDKVDNAAQRVYLKYETWVRERTSK